MVVRREFGHVAIEAGGVEGEHAVGPIEGLVAAIGKMPHAAGRHVVPGLLVDIVGQGQHLQAAALQWREQIIDVLPTHDVNDGVFVLTVGAAFADALVPLAKLDMVLALADGDIALLRRQVGLGKGGRIGLHGQAVPRRGPELVEIGVALLAGLGAGQGFRAAAAGVSDAACFGGDASCWPHPIKNIAASRDITQIEALCFTRPTSLGEHRAGATGSASAVVATTPALAKPVAHSE